MELSSLIFFYILGREFTITKIQKKPKKTPLSEKFFLLFQKTEVSSAKLKKLLIFQEGTCKA